jgi:DHA1 family multidrug resistance protein-like MFS transporter
VRDWRVLNGLFVGTTILQGLSFGHVNAFLPLYLAELGLTPTEVSSWTGIMYAAMMGVAFPLAPFWGALAERYSRRLVIVRSQYIETVAHLMLVLAPDVWWVLAARILVGLTFGSIAVVIATQTLLTPRQHVGTAIASVQAAMPVAASVGPPVGALLIDLVGLRGLFLIDAGLALTAALLLTFLMPEPPKARRKSSVLARTGQTISMVWHRPVLRWNFLCLFLSIGSRAVVEVYLPVQIAEIAEDPAPTIGLILGVSGMVTAIATFASARLVDEHGGMRWFMPLMLVAALATLGMALFPNVLMIGLLTCIRALPYAAANTILVAHLTRVVPRADQTVVLSLTPLPRNTAMFAVPIIAAAVAPFGVGLALAVGALSYAAGAITGWLAERSTAVEIARRGHHSDVQARPADP